MALGLRSYEARLRFVLVTRSVGAANREQLGPGLFCQSLAATVVPVRPTATGAPPPAFDLKI